MQYRMKGIVKKWWAPLGALLILVLNAIFSFFPQAVEALYYKGFFQAVRVIHDHTLGLLPFPFVYILAAVLVWALYYVWIHPFRQKHKRPFPFLVYRFLTMAGVVVILFYVLWGFNYQRNSLSKQLFVERPTIGREDFMEEVKWMDGLIGKYRERLNNEQSELFTPELNTHQLENHIRKVQTQWLHLRGQAVKGRVRVRVLMPAGILLRFSTAGIYIPFANEGHIDGGLHPIQMPFTLAHEMAHGYGLTDEGECNFVAFITCALSNDPFVNYSGMLSYYRYLLQNLRQMDRSLYQQYIDQMYPPVWEDIVAINEQMNKFPDIMPALRDVVYDTYLKSHGVSEGLMSYSSIIGLVMQWKTSNLDEELVRSIDLSSEPQ